MVARKLHHSDRTAFQLCEEMRLDGSKDLAYSNGVFHHIPVGERAGAVTFVRRALRPGGLFALWENNPWNPGTRYVMSRIPFDRDAITLSMLEASRLLRAGGFEVLRTDFLVCVSACVEVVPRSRTRAEQTADWCAGPSPCPQSVSRLFKEEIGRQHRPPTFDVADPSGAGVQRGGRRINRRSNADTDCFRCTASRIKRSCSSGRNHVETDAPGAPTRGRPGPRFAG